MKRDQFVTSEEFINQILAEAGLSKDDPELNYQYALERIAEFFTAYRHEHQMTQKELAEKLSVSQTMVAKYERGDYNFSLKTLMRVLDAIGYYIGFSFSPNTETARSWYADSQEGKKAPAVEERMSIPRETYTLYAWPTEMGEVAA